MTVEEKKKELQNIIATADDELTNVLMEAAAEYQAVAKENFVVPQEWMDEFDKRLADLENGKDKGSDPWKTLETAKQKLDEFKNQQRSHVI